MLKSWTCEPAGRAKSASRAAGHVLKMKRLNTTVAESRAGGRKAALRRTESGRIRRQATATTEVVPVRNRRFAPLRREEADARPSHGPRVGDQSNDHQSRAVGRIDEVH